MKEFGLPMMASVFKKCLCRLAAFIDEVKPLWGGLRRFFIFRRNRRFI
jgi:hypothetical protein